jgi:hypothetical protein
MTIICSIHQPGLYLMKWRITSSPQKMAQGVYSRYADDVDYPPSGSEEGDLMVKILPGHNSMVALFRHYASNACFAFGGCFIKAGNPVEAEHDFHILCAPDII